jgi:hypothetical protein
MATNRPASQIKHTTQNILNYSYDEANEILAVELVGYDGQNLQKLGGDTYATKVVTSGTDTYVGQAAPGTTAATTKWQAFKVDTSGNVTWADGNASFDNAATDLASLSYT